MLTRRRLCLAAGYAGFAVCIATLIMLLISTIFEVLWSYGNGDVFMKISEGGMIWYRKGVLPPNWIFQPEPDGWGIHQTGYRWASFLEGLRNCARLPQWGTYAGIDFISIPLWLIIATVGPVAAFLWYRGRRRPGPGHCPNCNYDLTGNESGKCSECGAVIASTPPSAVPPLDVDLRT